VAFLTLYSETALHVGIGQELGPVDLPVHRERHTGIPIIPGSGLRGALRALAVRRARGETDTEKRKTREGDIKRFFGPVAGDQLQQGLLVVGEAMPLAIPFRSLNGVFAWATCPLLLDRFVRRTRESLEWDVPADGEATAGDGAGTIVIEDIDFRRKAGKCPDLSKWLPATVAKSHREANGNGQGTQTVVGSRLVVLSDNDFCWLVRHCLPVASRVRLTEGKTTGEWEHPTEKDQQGKPLRDEGSLWAEEAVPPDTIWYAPISEVPRESKAGAVSFVTELVGAEAVFQIGGDETVGLGWCWVKANGDGTDNPNTAPGTGGGT